jgi:hypothetical protein
MGDNPDRQNTTWEQDKARLLFALKSDWKDLHHALMNIPVEATRRDAQKYTKLYLLAIAFLIAMLVWST